MDPDFPAEEYIKKATVGRTAAAPQQPAPARPPPAQPSSSSPNTGTGTRAPPPPSRAYGGATYGDARAQLRLFMANTALVVMGVYAAIPFPVPWGRAAYLNFMRLVMLSCGYRLYLHLGAPPLRPPWSMALVRPCATAPTHPAVPAGWHSPAHAQPPPRPSRTLRP